MINREMTGKLQEGVPDASPQLLVQVASEIYLVIPDNVVKDRKLVGINKKNFISGMDLLAGSAVFDFGAAFRAYRFNPSQEDSGK